MKFLIYNLLLIFFLTKNIFSQDTLATNFEKLQIQQHKNPTTSMLLSTLLPGAGQIYNESYYKTPIIWGSLGFLGYYFKIYQDKYDEYSSLYKDKLKNNDATANSYARIRDFYFKRRDEMGIYLLLIYLANIVDAYVDAQLFDFNIVTPTTPAYHQSNFSNLSLQFKISF